MFQKLSGRSPGFLDQDQQQKYAVVAPFLADTREFLFQVRSPSLHSQPGEICFPGGRIEGAEEPPEAAIRETVEELLVSREQIELVAPLDMLYTPNHAIIYPYLAYLRGYGFTFNRDEVGEVFTVPFDFFLSHEPETLYTVATIAPEHPERLYDLLGTETYPWRTAKTPILFYQYGDRLIWGMTAKFVRNIVQLYRAG